MTCKKCNAELPEGALFCPECMDRFAVNEQKAKLEEASKASKNTTLVQLHSPLFLVAAICFSVMFLSLVISMFSGGIFGIISNLLPFIFMLIAVIGLWNGYLAKEDTDLNKVLRNASIFDAYNNVMYIISLIFVIIGGIIVVAMSFIGGGLITGLLNDGSEADAAAGGLLASLIPIIVLIIAIVIISIIRSIFKNRRKYFVDLGQSVVSGHYKIKKAPIVGSFVVGIFSILGAVPAFAFTALKTALLDPLFAEMGEFGAFLESFLAGLGVMMIIGAIGGLIKGGYYICSGLWIKSVHHAQLVNGAAVAAAQAALEKVTAETAQAIHDFEFQRKKHEEEARAEADQAAKQQQMMMQQMMMQMMMQQQQQQQQANQAAAPVVEPAPAAEAAPVAEAAPAAEAAPTDAPTE